MRFKRKTEKKRAAAFAFVTDPRKKAQCQNINNIVI